MSATGDPMLERPGFSVQHRSGDDGDRPWLSTGARPAGADARHSSTAGPMLSLRGVRREFGGVVAVRDASFDVLAGHITGLIGPNGAGKSTVINIMSGQTTASEGTVEFRGQNLLGKSPEWVAHRGIVRTFQTARLFERMTVTENLLLGPLPYRGETLRAALRGARAWKREQDEFLDNAASLLERFDMVAHRDAYAADLSGGQKRLVEIMRALMSKPTLLLLDEPMAGVSPAMSRRIAADLLALRDEGLTMLLVEHELPLVELLCEPVIVMVEGAVLAEGSLSELRNNEEVVRAYLAE